MSEFKFTNKKYDRIIYVYAKGYGKNADLGIHYSNFHETFYHRFEIETAKKFMEALKFAIDDAEKRKLIKEIDEEEE